MHVYFCKVHGTTELIFYSLSPTQSIAVQIEQTSNIRPYMYTYEKQYSGIWNMILIRSVFFFINIVAFISIIALADGGHVSVTMTSS